MVRTGHPGSSTCSSRSSLLDPLRWHAGHRWMRCWPIDERSPSCSSQTARWLGCVFLVLEVGGQLPGFFAYPAAFGDIAVGVTACVAVIALIWSTSTAIPVAWSVLGLLDFVGAVGTGFLASQALAVVHADPPTSVFTQWPMVLFPAYMVPFSIILHLTTIRVLLANRRRALDEHTSVATSEMRASR